MRYFLLAWFVSACTLAAQPSPGTGSIEGHVFNSLSGAPLRKATVELTADPTPTYHIRLVADTDAAGKFQFTGLPPGTYRLSGSRAGFLGHPAHHVVSLGPDDHVTDSEIRLPPQGVIAGRILDEDDDPSPEAWVSIYKQVYRDSGKRWVRLNRSSYADEAGEYRFPNLTPGSYILQADNRRPQADNQYHDQNLPAKPGMSYVPVYYRNGTTQQAALPVDVGVGAELRGIDIHLFKLAQPPYFNVKGKVTGLQPSQTQIGLCLLPVDGPGCSTYPVAGPPDYVFDARVPPGQYTVLGSVYSGGPEAYGSASVTVTGDVAGIIVAMSPAPEMTGTISLAERGGQVNLRGVRVTLNDLPFEEMPQQGRSDASGKFTFGKPIRPGHYSMNVDPQTIPAGCFVREVKLGGQEVSSIDFEIQISRLFEIVSGLMLEGAWIDEA